MRAEQSLEWPPLTNAALHGCAATERTALPSFSLSVPLCFLECSPPFPGLLPSVSWIVALRFLECCPLFPGLLPSVPWSVPLRCLECSPMFPPYAVPHFVAAAPAPTVCGPLHARRLLTLSHARVPAEDFKKLPGSFKCPACSSTKNRFKVYKGADVRGKPNNTGASMQKRMGAKQW